MKKTIWLSLIFTLVFSSFAPAKQLAGDYVFQQKAARHSVAESEKLEADKSPDGKYESFVRGNNLFVVERATGKETQMTRDGDANHLNGILDWVYEEELYGRGNKRGYWWSPDSTRIAFLHFDETLVPRFAVVNHISETENPARQSIENTPYPKAGDPNPIVTLGVADVKTGAVRFVDVSNYKPEDFLISRVSWSPDSQRVVFQAQNREQTFLDLNAADRDSLKTTLLLRETSPAWVEVIDNPRWLVNGSFLWASARTGWRHLYHFDQGGKLIRQLTGGDWEITDFHGVDERDGFVYFSATKDGAINKNVYRVKSDGGAVQRLTPEDGVHNADFDKTLTRFVDQWSNINTPPQVRSMRADGTGEKILLDTKYAKPPPAKIGAPELVKVKTRDNFEMEAMLVKPPGFDPRKKYPVMQLAYSGPHAPSVRNEWGAGLEPWAEQLLKKNYLIWICDNRTASGKGAQSVYGLYQNFGASELRDLEDGLNYLKTLPFVDASRFGLYGWSYGGYMTSYAMTHSKMWKVGVAGGTVADWRLYDSIYTERYMRTPQNNPAGYEKSSVTAAAANLNGKLLLIHGAIDDNVHLQNTMQFVYALQKAGKQFDLMLYPTQRHGVGDPQQREHLNQKITDYILANL